MNIDRVDLLAEKWVQQGFTISHLNSLPVFIHGAQPGERVKAEIVKRLATHAFAVTEKIISPREKLVASDCPVFPKCGGCSFRHISYEEEIELKKRLLVEYKHIWNSLSGFEDCYFSASPNGYRNYVQLHFAGEGPGFFMLHTNSVVPLPLKGCALLGERLNRAIRRHDFQKIGKRLRFRETDDRIIGPEEINGESEAEAFLNISSGISLNWKFPARGFFQINRFLIEKWLGYIRKQIPLNSPVTVDLFCGSALIGGCCHDLLGKYSGYEIDQKALESGRYNHRVHGMESRFIKIDLNRNFPDFSGIDLVITNPPAAGMKKALILKQIKDRVKWVLYSSCNPATLNRDLGIYFRHRYLRETAALFDFFPRTPHLEAVILLKRDIV